MSVDEITPPEESNDRKQVDVSVDSVSQVGRDANIAGGSIAHAEQGSTVIQGSTLIQGSTVIFGAPAVASGFLALRELMQNSPDVRTAVVEFETDFKVAREQVDRLGDYKDLHDLLHRLQFHCYTGIALARTRFPDDELILDILNEHALTLAGIVEELRQVAMRPSMPKQELTWVEDVRTARVELGNAMETLSPELLKKVTWRLNRLLATQPARINALLNHSARSLHLPALLGALARISTYLASLHLDDTDRGHEFLSGVAELGRLDQELSALVDEHDRWQALDVELHRIKASIEDNLGELEMSWADVKLMAEPLYLSLSDEWAIALRQDGETLDAVLKGDNPMKARGAFRNYERRAADRFYRVDIQLKALCGTLREIRDPLASVLEKIE